MLFNDSAVFFVIVHLAAWFDHVVGHISEVNQYVVSFSTWMGNQTNNLQTSRRSRYLTSDSGELSLPSLCQ